MLVGLIKVLAYAVRERILVLDGASIGDQEHHSGEIIIGYDAALMPQRIDTLVAASSHFKDPYWREILTQATINQIPIILDSEYRETLQGRVDLTLIDAEKLIEMRLSPSISGHQKDDRSGSGDLWHYLAGSVDDHSGGVD